MTVKQLEEGNFVHFVLFVKHKPCFLQGFLCASSRHKSDYDEASLSVSPKVQILIALPDRRENILALVLTG